VEICERIPKMQREVLIITSNVRVFIVLPRKPNVMGIKACGIDA
jgi:hypothetical protein